jgi:hypothetical protein
MNLNDIYAELLEACATIEGLETYGVMSESINVPCIVPDAPEIVEYDLTYGGALNRAELRLKVIASRTSMEDGMALLLELVSFEGDLSVKEVLESADYESLTKKPRVLRAEQFGSIQFGSVSYLVCDLIVEIKTSK